MNTRVKRTTLFAMIALLLVVTFVAIVPNREASAANPGEPQYYTDRWNEVSAKVTWKDTGLPEWNGGATQPTVGTGTTTDPYKVTTAEQFRWCLANQKSCQLQNDLDLGGRSGKNWIDIKAETAFTVDGNGHTIYNLFSRANHHTGLIAFSNNVDFVLKNLVISNAKVNCTNTGTYGAPLVAQFTCGQVINCGVENALVWQDNANNKVWAVMAGAISFGGVGANGYSGTPSTKLVKNTYTDNVHVYGGACSSGFIEAPFQNATIEDCYAVNGTLIVPGGHSGGFASCDTGPNVYRNCFTNIDVYGNNQTGVFQGVVHGGSHVFENCYASGKIEGTDTIGGFIGADSGSSGTTFTNCYSTSMVGMSNGGKNMGGFAGLGSNLTFTNCYAAGEVGTLRSAADGTPLDANGGELKNERVTGFAGDNSGNFTNCFYDKQTTGMCNYGEVSSRVTGLLTKQLFAQDLGDGWTRSAGGYPELKVFSQSDNGTVRACSTASASTVQLWADEDAYNATKSLDSYDTVRKIRYVFPLTNNANSGKPEFSIKWANYLGEDPSHPLYPNVSPLVDGDVPIITLSDIGSKDNVSSVAPGIGWLQVNATDDATGDTGMRRLRLVPTTAIALASFGNLSLGDLDTVCSNIDASLSSKWDDMDEKLFTQDHKPVGEFQDYDHRSNISFVTTSATAINSFILSGYTGSASENVDKFNSTQTSADKKIIVEGFPKNADGTFKDGTPVSGDATTLRYYKGAGDTGDILDVKLFRQVGGTAENPIWEEAAWTPEAVDAFHGGTVVPEMRGTYKLEYEWKDPTGTIVQAQGQKKITISEPAYIVYHLNDGTTLDESAAGTDDYDVCAIDPGDYRVGETINSDPAAGHKLHKLDPNYTIKGHNEYYWSTTRQAQPVVAQSDNEITAQADYVAKEFTEDSALHAGRNDVYATWIPNPHNLVITKTNDGTLDPTDPNNQAATTDKATYGSKVEDIIKTLSPEGSIIKPDPASELLGWKMDYDIPDPENPDDPTKTQHVSEVITPDTTMPDADVVIVPLWKATPELTKAVTNLTHATGENKVGDTLEYTITATNKAPGSTWQNVTVTDKLPAGITLVEGSLIAQMPGSADANSIADDQIYNKDEHALSWNVGNIQGGETAILKFKATINDKAIDYADSDEGKANRDISNTVSVTGSKDSNDKEIEIKEPTPVTPNPGDGQKWPVTPSDPKPEITKTVTNKTDPNGYLQVDDVLTYEITLKNAEPNSLWKDVKTTDPLPGGVDFVPGSIKLIQPDGTEIPVSDTAFDPKTRSISVDVGSLGGNEEAKLFYDVKINEKAITGDGDDKPIGSTATATGTTPHDEDATVNSGDPAYPVEPDDHNVYWADPYSEVTKTAQNMSRDTAPTHVGDTVRYVLTAENTKPNSLWKDVVFFDKIPQGLDIDTASIALVDPEGKTHTVNANAYDAKTRIIAVYAGDLLVNQKAILSFEVKVTEGALNKDIGNIGMAKGGTDVPNGDWVEAGPYSIGDGYHPRGGGEQIPEGTIATGAVYPFPEDNINEFFDGHRGGVVNVDGSPATSDFTFAVAGGVSILALAALATVVYTRRKMKTKA